MSSRTSPELDHLVFGGPDLAAAVARIAELTGVTAVPGGRHTDEGTANYLIGLGPGAYLEIVGPDPKAAEPAQPRWFGLDEVPEPRLLTWAVRSADLDAAVLSARAGGYDPGTARAMSRVATDGTRLQWRLTPDTVAEQAGVVPFLIDWGTTAHPSTRELPQLELLALSAAYPDADRVRAELSALGVQLAVVPGRPALRAVLAGPHGKVVLP